MALLPEAPPGPAGDARRIALETPEAEVEAAARWARGLLDAGAGGPVNVVFPDLETRLATVEACFEDLLHPSLEVAPAAARGERAFNVSLGRPLARERVVADAMGMLEADSGALGAGAASTLLLSPYLGADTGELRARSLLDATLRDHGVRRIRVRHLARLSARQGASRLARSLEALEGAAPGPRARVPLADHARRFARLLDVLGWPSGRALESGEYQAVEAFRRQLHGLGSLDSVLAPCTAGSALGLLAGALRETLFQPRAEPAAVQISGALEAAGMSGSHLWLAAAHDGAWPPPETASPLLPVALQRRHGMPGASPAESLEWARRLGRRLLASAPCIVVSRARMDGDTPLRESALFGYLPVASATEISFDFAPLPDESVAAAAPELQWLGDWQGRPVGQGFHARGGSRVLTDQAACPFRAFARHRLGARGAPRASAPLDARTRGTVAHRFMQELLTEIPDQQALEHLSPDARDALAEEAAARAVTAVLRRHRGEIPRALAEAERRRLRRLAGRWFSIEGARAPFQVEALEQRRRVRVGGLDLDIQLDRVDRVGDGRMLVDYKTGSVDRAGWFGDRPQDPQLPLYALALDAQGAAGSPVRAVGFARLKRGQEGFDGVAEDPGWAPGLRGLGAGTGAQREFPDMGSLKSHWGRVLGRLAEDFAGGQAPVDPLPEACRYCDLRALCRLDDLGAVPEEEA